MTVPPKHPSRKQKPRRIAGASETRAAAPDSGRCAGQLLLRSGGCGGGLRRWRSRCGRRAAFLLRPALLHQTRGLADALAQVVQLGPAALAAALDRHAGDERRVEWIDALNAFIVHNPADGEGRVDAAALLHD